MAMAQRPAWAATGWSLGRGAGAAQVLTPSQRGPGSWSIHWAPRGGSPAVPLPRGDTGARGVGSLAQGPQLVRGQELCSRAAPQDWLWESGRRDPLPLRELSCRMGALQGWPWTLPDSHQSSPGQ